MLHKTGWAGNPFLSMKKHFNVTLTFVKSLFYVHWSFCLYEGVGSPGIVVTESCELPCGCWKLNLGSLEEQDHRTIFPALTTPIWTKSVKGKVQLYKSTLWMAVLWPCNFTVWEQETQILKERSYLWSTDGHLSCHLRTLIFCLCACSALTSGLFHDPFTLQWDLNWLKMLRLQSHCSCCGFHSLIQASLFCSAVLHFEFRAWCQQGKHQSCHAAVFGCVLPRDVSSTTYSHPSPNSYQKFPWWEMLL